MSASADGNKQYDPLYQLEQHADHLNAINKPARREEVFYELMSGALVWRDETNEHTPIEVVWALRFVVAYRTSLMLNEPRNGFKPIWDRAMSLFPNWVGFRAERREPTPKLLDVYRRGEVGTRKRLRDIEREMGPDTEND